MCSLQQDQSHMKIHILHVYKTNLHNIYSTSYHRLSLPLKLGGSGAHNVHQREALPKKEGPTIFGQSILDLDQPVVEKHPNDCIFFLVMVRLENPPNWKKSMKLHEIHDLQTFFQKLLLFFSSKKPIELFHQLTPSSFRSGHLAQGAFEVRPTTATAQPSQPSGEEHSLQAQQVPCLSTDPSRDGDRWCWKTRIESNLRNPVEQFWNDEKKEEKKTCPKRNYWSQWSN